MADVNAIGARKPFYPSQSNERISKKQPSVTINFSPNISNGSSSWRKMFALLFLGALGYYAAVNYGPSAASIKSTARKFVLSKVGINLPEMPGWEQIREKMASFNPFTYFDENNKAADPSQNPTSPHYGSFQGFDQYNNSFDIFENGRIPTNFFGWES